MLRRFDIATKKVLGLARHRSIGHLYLLNPLVDAIFSFISPAIYVPFTTNVVHNIVVLLRSVRYSLTKKVSQNEP